MSYTSHRESRVVAASVERMFDLVADVERYPEFLPLIRSATIVRREASAYKTEQVLALGPLAHRFLTHTELKRPSAILVTSPDASFRRFDIRWSFEPTPEGFCHISFALDCEMNSLLLRPLGDALVTKMAATMVNAFVGRARKLYTTQRG
ncbi:MAG: type II toxin-antitoxin system RatA family toxin [Candidatus Competibacteraceae bacterium]|nr:type II toxin-antitoxin system RatA family toxin [Candidatus Competibacteraceae bacterium]